VKNNTRYTLVAVLLSISLLTGCTGKRIVPDVNLISINYIAAEQLLASSGSLLSKSQPVLITSFVNIDDLTRTSTFGRITSEQIGSKLSQNGYSVIEMKLRNSVFIKEQSGEFILSRELKSLSTLHDAQAVLVGTYAIASSSIYVTAKLIQTANGIVLSSYDYVLPMGADAKVLLK
jgi:TolB-like protein